MISRVFFLVLTLPRFFPGFFNPKAGTVNSVYILVSLLSTYSSSLLLLFRYRIPVIPDSFQSFVSFRFGFQNRIFVYFNPEGTGNTSAISGNIPLILLVSLVLCKCLAWLILLFLDPPLPPSLFKADAFTSFFNFTPTSFETCNPVSVHSSSLATHSPLPFFLEWESMPRAIPSKRVFCPLNRGTYLPRHFFSVSVFSFSLLFSTTPSTPHVS